MTDRDVNIRINIDASSARGASVSIKEVTSKVQSLFTEVNSSSNAMKALGSNASTIKNLEGLFKNTANSAKNLSSSVNNSSEAVSEFNAALKYVSAAAQKTTSANDQLAESIDKVKSKSEQAQKQARDSKGRFTKADSLAIAPETKTTPLLQSERSRQDIIDKAVEDYDITAEQANRIINLQKKEADATTVAAFAYNAKAKEIQKMTFAQKIAAGQWQSAFPVLNKMNNALNTVRWSMVNVTFALAGLAILASPFILLTKSGMEYEHQLRQIAAVSGEIFQTTQGRSAITGAVAGVAIGRPTTFAEAADAMLEFQRAGFSLSQSMRDVPHIIDLSVAGFVDLGKSVKIVSSVLHQFETDGLTAAHAVDVIAKASVASATTVEEFGNALSYVGPLASSVGITFEETAAALALLSNAGMRGSRAGTTLRQVLAKISSVSKQGEDSMARLGVSFYTAEGQTKSLQEILTTLNVSMRGMTEQQKQLFISEMFEIRSKSGIAAMLNLIEDNSSAINDFMTVLQDSGFAARTAADIQEGSAMRMKTAWGNLMITIQPLAMQFNNMFAVMIGAVEKFSEAMLVATRKKGLDRLFSVAGAIPLSVQIVGLVAAIAGLKIALTSVYSSLVAYVATNTTATVSTIANSAATKVNSQTKLMNVIAKAKETFATNVNSQARLMNVMAIARETFATNAVTTATTKNIAVKWWSVAASKAQVVVTTVLTAAKFGLATATKAVGVALKALYAFLGPFGIALLAIGATILAVNKGMKDLSSITREQTSILANYNTQLDISKTRLDAYTQAGLTNAIATEKEFSSTMESQRDLFEQQMKQLSRAQSAAEQSFMNIGKGAKGVGVDILSITTPMTGLYQVVEGLFKWDWGIIKKGISELSAPLNAIRQSFTMLLGEISAFQVLGAKDYFATANDPAKRLEMVTAKINQIERDTRNELRRQTEERETQVLVENIGAASLLGFLDKYRQGSLKLEDSETSRLLNLAKESNEFETVLSLLAKREQIEKQLEEKGSNAILEEELKLIEAKLTPAIIRMRDTVIDKNQDTADSYKKVIQAVDEEAEALDNLRVVINKIAKDIEGIFSAFTPETSRIMSQFGDTDKLFGSEGLINTIENVHGANAEYADLITYLIGAREEFFALTDQLAIVEMRHDLVSKAIETQQNLIKEQELAISALNEVLKEHDDLISRLSSMRFVGETDVDKLLHSISQNISKAELEAWGIVDVVGFLEDAVNNVDGSWDGVLSKMREVEEAGSKSQNQYDAWRKTVQAHIRALIIEGNDLAKSTTDAVRRHANMLMQVSKFDSSSSGGKTDEELRLEALQKAYDHHYGGMHQDVALAIQANEDLANVHNESSETIIRALQSEWSQRDKIIKQIKIHEDAIRELSEEEIYFGYNLRNAIILQQRYKNEIDGLVEQIVGPDGLIAAVGLEILKYEELGIEIDDITKKYLQMAAAKASATGSRGSSGRSGGSSGGINVNPDGSLGSGAPNFSPSPDFSPTPRDFSHVVVDIPMSINHPRAPLSGFGGRTYDDFVWRPGSEPIGFSKDDTLVGVKDTSGLGGVTIQNINVSASTNNPKELARQLAAQIKRELRAV